jgi:hypothetical protein
MTSCNHGGNLDQPVEARTDPTENIHGLHGFTVHELGSGDLEPPVEILQFIHYRLRRNVFFHLGRFLTLPVVRAGGGAGGSAVSLLPVGPRGPASLTGFGFCSWRVSTM